ncbi:MAG: dephospho-CoA kinase [Buchnera aphidicola (Nurudea ibofushi)]
MTYIVALIGGIGSGKTTISNLFEKIGIKIIDADIITRNILKNDKNVINEILNKFGPKCLNIDKTINRKYLKNYIFSHNLEKSWLEKILHPIIIKRMKEDLNIVKTPWCLWVVPLLIEMKLYKYANRILLIDTPVSEQIKRITKRDKIDKIQAKLIISSQVTREERFLFANDIINNTKTIKILKMHAKNLNEHYLKLSKSII